MMEGAHIAKRVVTDYLEADLPSRLVAFRNHWNVDDDDLPDPLEFKTFEPLAIDAWPMVYTVAITTTSFDRIGYDLDSNPEYRTTYTMRTYVWVKDGSAEECTLKRDRLSTAIRSALLDHPSLNAADLLGCEPLIQEESLREEFSDLTLIKGDRFMAGAYCGYNLSITETITRRGYGQLSEFNLEVLPLPTPPDPNF